MTKVKIETNNSKTSCSDNDETNLLVALNILRDRDVDLNITLSGKVLGCVLIQAGPVAELGG